MGQAKLGDCSADASRLDDVRRMAETLLANPVIEDFTVRAERGDG